MNSKQIIVKIKTILKKKGEKITQRNIGILCGMNPDNFSTTVKRDETRTRRQLLKLLMVVEKDLFDDYKNRIGAHVQGGE